MMGRDSKEKTLSPGPQRSESSSDISVLSNPSESSIEVLEPSSERHQQHQEHLSISRLQESLNSSKLTSSEDSQTTGCSENTMVYSEGPNSMVLSSEGTGIYSESTLESAEGTLTEQDWEGRSAQRGEDGASIGRLGSKGEDVSSIETHERLGSKGEDVSSIEGEADNTFHSCRSVINNSLRWESSGQTRLLFLS